MKYLVHILFLTALVLADKSLAQENPDAIIGHWDADNKTIEVYKSGDKFIGNPISPEGNRIEKIQVLNLTYADKKWVGKLYSKKKDRRFDVVCQVIDDKMLVKVNAGFVSKEVEWTRLQDQ